MGYFSVSTHIKVILDLLFQLGDCYSALFLKVLVFPDQAFPILRTDREFGHVLEHIGFDHE